MLFESETCCGSIINCVHSGPKTNTSAAVIDSQGRGRSRSRSPKKRKENTEGTSSLEHMEPGKGVVVVVRWLPRLSLLLQPLHHPPRRSISTSLSEQNIRPSISSLSVRLSVCLFGHLMNQTSFPLETSPLELASLLSKVKELVSVCWLLHVSVLSSVRGRHVLQPAPICVKPFQRSRQQTPQFLPF